MGRYRRLLTDPYAQFCSVSSDSEGDDGFLDEDSGGYVSGMSFWAADAEVLQNQHVDLASSGEQAAVPFTEVAAILLPCWFPGDKESAFQVNQCADRYRRLCLLNLLVASFTLIPSSRYSFSILAFAKRSVTLPRVLFTVLVHRMLHPQTPQDVYIRLLSALHRLLDLANGSDATSDAGASAASSLGPVVDRNVSYPACCIAAGVRSGAVDAGEPDSEDYTAFRAFSACNAHRSKLANAAPASTSAALLTSQSMYYPSIIDILQLHTALNGAVCWIESHSDGGRESADLEPEEADLALGKVAGLLSLWSRLLHALCPYLPATTPEAILPANPCRATLQAISTALALKSTEVIDGITSLCQRLHNAAVALSCSVSTESSAAAQLRWSPPALDACASAALLILRSVRKMATFTQVIKFTARFSTEVKAPELVRSVSGSSAAAQPSSMTADLEVIGSMSGNTVVAGSQSTHVPTQRRRSRGSPGPASGHMVGVHPSESLNMYLAALSDPVLVRLTNASSAATLDAPLSMFLGTSTIAASRLS